MAVTSLGRMLVVSEAGGGHTLNFHAFYILYTVHTFFTNILFRKDELYCQMLVYFNLNWLLSRCIILGKFLSYNISSLFVEIQNNQMNTQKNIMVICILTLRINQYYYLGRYYFLKWLLCNNDT